MGDAGSFTLGYLLASISILGEWSTIQIVSCTVPVLILAVPLFDLGYVVLYRHFTGVTSSFREALTALCQGSFGASACAIRGHTEAGCPFYLPDSHLSGFGSDYSEDEHGNSFLQSSCFTNPDDSGDCRVSYAPKYEDSPEKPATGKRTGRYASALRKKPVRNPGSSLIVFLFLFFTYLGVGVVCEPPLIWNDRCQA